MNFVMGTERGNFAQTLTIPSPPNLGLKYSLNTWFSVMFNWKEKHEKWLECNVGTLIIWVIFEHAILNLVNFQDNLNTVRPLKNYSHWIRKILNLINFLFSLLFTGKDFVAQWPEHPQTIIRNGSQGFITSNYERSLESDKRGEKSELPISDYPYR